MLNFSPKHKSSYHAVGLQHARNLQPNQRLLPFLLTQQTLDHFRRQQAEVSNNLTSKDEGHAKKDTNDKSTTTLLQQTQHNRGIFWHLPEKPFTKSEKQRQTGNSTPTSESSTPTEQDAQHLMNLSPAALMSLLGKFSPLPSTTPSEASYVNIPSSPASSNHGDHYDVRSLAGTMPGSPWLSFPSRPDSPYLSRVPSSLLLEPAALEMHPIPHQKAKGHKKDDPIEESTETLKA